MDDKINKQYMNTGAEKTHYHISINIIFYIEKTKIQGGR